MAFDPYHKWLGIPPDQQPASHYRLLAIEAFESDADVIEAAAERQTVYLRTFQTGPNVELAERLLNEVAAVRVCLLNPVSKAEYDATFETGIGALQFDEPSSSRTTVASGTRSKPISKKNAGTTKPIKSVLSIVLGGAGGIVIAILLLWFAWGVDPFGFFAKTPKQVAESPAKSETAVTLPTVVPRDNAEEEGTEEKAAGPKPDKAISKDKMKKAAAEKPAAKAAMEKLAVVTVENMVAVPLTLNMVTKKTEKKSTDASLLPAFLQGATTWRFENPPGTNMANGVLRFKVIQAGRVYLIAHWQYQGNPSGGWLEERLTKEQLVEQGWQDLGPCSWDKEVYVLTRRVNEGESYAIRTNKYWPPYLAISASKMSPQGVSETSKNGTNSRGEPPNSLKKGLIAYYPFSGNAQDESGNDNHGQANGVVLTTDRFGVSGRAYQFNGKEYITAEIDNLPLRSEPRTISCWVKAILKNLPSPNATRILIQWGNPEQGQAFATHITGGTFCVTRSDSGISADSQWHHVVSIYDNAMMIYVDGMLRGTNQVKATTVSSQLVIGREVRQRLFFHGSLDDVRIYNRALSADEVKALYDFEKP